MNLTLKEGLPMFWGRCGGKAQTAQRFAVVGSGLQPGGDFPPQRYYRVTGAFKYYVFKG
jgi:hypothetical protein